MSIGTYDKNTAGGLLKKNYLPIGTQKGPKSPIGKYRRTGQTPLSSKPTLPLPKLLKKPK